MHQALWIQAGDSLSARYPQPSGAPTFIISDAPNFTNINFAWRSGRIFWAGDWLCKKTPTWQGAINDR
jgi:hypothetical protein